MMYFMALNEDCIRVHIFKLEVKLYYNVANLNSMSLHDMT